MLRMVPLPHSASLHGGGCGGAVAYPPLRNAGEGDHPKGGGGGETESAEGVPRGYAAPGAG